MKIKKILCLKNIIAVRAFNLILNAVVRGTRTKQAIHSPSNTEYKFFRKRKIINT
jgi:hypothetical protein